MQLYQGEGMIRNQGGNLPLETELEKLTQIQKHSKRTEPGRLEHRDLWYSK